MSGQDQVSSSLGEKRACRRCGQTAAEVGVKPDNVRTLMPQPKVDGVLVSGASLDAKFLREYRELLARARWQRQADVRGVDITANL